MTASGPTSKRTTGNPDGSLAGEAENYRRALRPLKAFYSYTVVKDFGPRALRAVRQKMIEMGWCRNVINRQIGRLKHVFKWGVSQELISPTIYQALLTLGGLRKGKSDAKETEPIKPVPEAHVEAVKPFLSSTVRAMVELQLLTGMRSTEVCIMRGMDIETSGDVWIYRPAFHKMQHHGHAREVWLGPQAKKIVQEQMKPDLKVPLLIRSTGLRGPAIEFGRAWLQMPFAAQYGIVLVVLAIQAAVSLAIGRWLFQRDRLLT